MRTIHVVLFAAVVLGAAVTIRAQGEQPVLQGLPQYGVMLSGSPEIPVVENHSGGVIIGYTVKFADANGNGLNLPLLMADSPVNGDSPIQPAGIAVGGSVYAFGARPVNPNMPKVIMAFRLPIPGGPLARAILQNVIFADGQFVGADENGNFERFGKRMQAIREVGMMAKTQPWSQVEAIARPPDGEFEDPNDPIRELTAMALVQERRKKGDAAARRLVEIYSSLPTLWK